MAWWLAAAGGAPRLHWHKGNAGEVWWLGTSSRFQASKLPPSTDLDYVAGGSVGGRPVCSPQ